jgi:hypothetical protein
MSANNKGFAGFLCEVTSKPVSFRDCLTCSQTNPTGCPMIPAVIHASINSIRDPDYSLNLARAAGADVGYSVTELIACPRQTRLKALHPWYEKPSAMYRMNRGTGYHAILSASAAQLKAQGAPFIAEQTLQWKFAYRGKSILLVGTPDLVEWKLNGFYVTDYKVTGKPPFARRINICPHCGEPARKLTERKYFCDHCQVELKSTQLERIYQAPQPRSSHVLQVNLYALLIEKNFAELQKQIQDADVKFAGAQIVYLPDDKPVRCDVELDRAAAMEFLKSRLAALIDPDLPPILDDADEVWKCDFCAVRQHCEQLHGAPVGKNALAEAETVLESAG